MTQLEKLEICRKEVELLTSKGNYDAKVSKISAMIHEAGIILSMDDPLFVIALLNVIGGYFGFYCGNLPELVLKNLKSLGKFSIQDAHNVILNSIYCLLNGNEVN